MALRTREIYRSAPNGDRWLLAHDPDSGRVYVRHEPNIPSGGQVADIEVGAFLIGTGSSSPEKQELLRLIVRWSDNAAAAAFQSRASKAISKSRSFFCPACMRRSTPSTALARSAFCPPCSRLFMRRR